jgi:hypothetical protein
MATLARGRAVLAEAEYWCAQERGRRARLALYLDIWPSAVSALGGRSAFGVVFRVLLSSSSSSQISLLVLLTPGVLGDL